jgi:hypothetical protein
MSLTLIRMKKFIQRGWTVVGRSQDRVIPGIGLN